MFVYYMVLRSRAECGASVKQDQLAHLVNRDYRVTNESGGYSLTTPRQSCSTHAQGKLTYLPDKCAGAAAREVN